MIMVRLALCLVALCSPTFISAFQPNVYVKSDSSDSNDPFAYQNVHCMVKSNVDLIDQLLTEFNQFMKHPTRNTSQLSPLLTEASQIGNDSWKLLERFELNFRNTQWQSFSVRHQWQLNAFTCLYNLQTEIRAALTLSGIRDQILPVARPRYARIDQLVPVDDPILADLFTVITEINTTDHLVAEYFNTSIKVKPTRDEILAQLDGLESSIKQLHEDYRKSMHVVWDRLYENGQELVPENVAHIRVMPLYIRFVTGYVQDFRKHLQASLI